MDIGREGEGKKKEGKKSRDRQQKDLDRGKGVVMERRKRGLGKNREERIIRGRSEEGGE